MKENEEIWLNDVLNSTKGMHRAKPSDNLFDKILQEVNTKSPKVIGLPQIRIAVAAAVILAVLNFVAVNQYSNQSSIVIRDENATTLISNYNFYE